MIKVISPSEYKTTAWKNGKGQTTELAISENSTIVNFDWRLSIASVVEDGPFSDFSGYDRNLLLLEGLGIQLIHDEEQIDLLDKPLSISSFNGASKTVGKLTDGPIIDFNLMTKQGKYKVEIKTNVEQKNIQIQPKDLCFVYSHHSHTTIESESQTIELPIKNLAILQGELLINISGKGLIVINLTEI